LPTDLEEARILHSRVPQAQADLLTQVVKVIRYIRVTMPTVRDKPGLRESIALLRSLFDEQIATLTAEVIDDHLGFIARGADDLTNLELGLSRLEKVAQTPDSLIERMIQEVFELIPKGNSKSSNGGAVMVTALIVNKRPEAEFLLIAPTIEIANIAFKQAKGTIRLDPALDKTFQIQDHIKKITHRRNGASLQIKAADTDVITGSKATGTMIDETHVFAKKGNAADIFVELRGASVEHEANLPPALTA
jgi:hypothetical protein